MKPVLRRGYHLRDKRRRNEQIVAYAQSHAQLTLQEIATRYGLTRARVSQILKAHAEDTP